MKQLLQLFRLGNKTLEQIIATFATNCVAPKVQLDENKPG